MAESNKIETTVRSVPVEVSGRDIQQLREIMAHEIDTLRELIQQHERFHAHVHASMDEAVSVAREAVNVRLMAMNELREQVTQERSEFLQRAVYDASMAEWQKWREAVNLAMTKFMLIPDYDRAHEALEHRVSTIERFTSNYQGRLWMLGAAVSAVVVLVNIALKFWK